MSITWSKARTHTRASLHVTEGSGQLVMDHIDPKEALQRVIMLFVKKVTAASIVRQCL